MKKSFKIIGTLVGGTLAAAVLAGGVAMAKSSPDNAPAPDRSVTIQQSNNPLGW